MSDNQDKRLSTLYDIIDKLKQESKQKDGQINMLSIENSQLHTEVNVFKTVLDSLQSQHEAYKAETEKEISRLQREIWKLK